MFLRATTTFAAVGLTGGFIIGWLNTGAAGYLVASLCFLAVAAAGVLLTVRKMLVEPALDRELRLRLAAAKSLRDEGRFEEAAEIAVGTTHARAREILRS